MDLIINRSQKRGFIGDDIVRTSNLELMSLPSVLTTLCVPNVLTFSLASTTRGSCIPGPFLFTWLAGFMLQIPCSAFSPQRDIP